MGSSIGKDPFSLDNGALESPAFTRSFRTLALVLVAGICRWGYELWHTGRLVGNPSFSAYWLLAAPALLVITLIYIFRSKTRLDNTHLRQSWMWNKEMPIDSLVFAKLIRMPGFDWLIAPRLYVRAASGKFTVFYAASTEMLKQFDRLSVFINRHR